MGCDWEKPLNDFFDLRKLNHANEKNWFEFIKHKREQSASTHAKGVTSPAKISN